MDQQTGFQNADIAIRLAQIGGIAKAFDKDAAHRQINQAIALNTGLPIFMASGWYGVFTP